MAINPYHNITTSPDLQVFDFISSGVKLFKKRVKFELIDDKEQVYNLALCTLLDNELEDCETASRNGDMIRVLETVGIIALMFTDRYPDRKIYFTGSDALRTRQYQLGIFSHLKAVLDHFIIEGFQFEGKELKLREPFRTGKNYDAFIFMRKKS
ncbi:MAG TPA: hypothetical protein VIM16_03470 [Mucilaginibacter sp.]|jgi:hypothetical protein